MDMTETIELLLALIAGGIFGKMLARALGWGVFPPAANGGRGNPLSKSDSSESNRKPICSCPR